MRGLCTLHRRRSVRSCTLAEGGRRRGGCTGPRTGFPVLQKSLIRLTDLVGSPRTSPSHPRESGPTECSFSPRGRVSAWHLGVGAAWHAAQPLSGLLSGGETMLRHFVRTRTTPTAGLRGDGRLPSATFREARTAAGGRSGRKRGKTHTPAATSGRNGAQERPRHRQPTRRWVYFPSVGMSGFGKRLTGTGTVPAPPVPSGV